LALICSAPIPFSRLRYSLDSALFPFLSLMKILALSCFPQVHVPLSVSSPLHFGFKQWGRLPSFFPGELLPKDAPFAEWILSQRGVFFLFIFRSPPFFLRAPLLSRIFLGGLRRFSWSQLFFAFFPERPRLRVCLNFFFFPTHLFWLVFLSLSLSLQPPFRAIFLVLHRTPCSL